MQHPLLFVPASVYWANGRSGIRPVSLLRLKALQHTVGEGGEGDRGGMSTHQCRLTGLTCIVQVFLQAGEECNVGQRCRERADKVVVFQLPSKRDSESQLWKGKACVAEYQPLTDNR